MFPLRYAYLLSILLFCLLYLLVFLMREDVRVKMLKLSIGGSIVGPISNWFYLKDYWRPEFILGRLGIIEDLLFAFLTFGFTAGVVNLVTRTRSKEAKIGHPTRWRYVVAAVILLGCLVIPTFFWGINSIYASAIGFISFSVLMWWERPDLLRYSLIGASILVLLGLFGYRFILVIWPSFFDNWWLWGNITGIRIFQIPLEEFLWFGTWGLVGSIIYEWRHGSRFIPLARS